MKIIGGKVIVCSPGRNFVTLKLETEDGVYGLGDATLNGRELAVASYLRDHVLPLLEGRDARRIEDIWQFLYKGAYWRRGPVTMAAIAAVDTALWDIKGKTLSAPVYQLLGGASREAVMVYGHASGDTIEDTVAAAGGFVARGYKAVRAQCGVPGLQNGVRHGGRRAPTSRPSAARCRRRSGAASATWRRWRRSSSACAASSAPTCICCTTCIIGCGRSRPRVSDARSSRIVCSGWRIRRRRRIQESFRLIRQHTTTPLAVGEVFNTIHDCRQLIQEQLIDYIRTTVVHAGGISHLRKIASLAELYQVRTGSHGATDLSPVCMAAALHFDLSVHNFGIQEYMPHTAETDRVFPHAYTFAERRDAPGRRARTRRRYRRDAGRDVPVSAGVSAGRAARRRHHARLVGTRCARLRSPSSPPRRSCKPLKRQRRPIVR